MPRIAAAVAVVVTIGISIGINIARFPVVWEMVGRTAANSASTSKPATTLPNPPAPVDAWPSPVGRSDAQTLSSANPPIRSMSSAPIAPDEAMIDQGRLPAQMVSISSDAEDDAAEAPESVESQWPTGGDDAGPAHSGGYDRFETEPPRASYQHETQWPAETAQAMGHTASRPFSTTVPGADRSSARKPLVPVIWDDGPPAAKTPARTVSASATIERLPPTTDAPIPIEDPRRTPDGPIPVYPSTGR